MERIISAQNTFMFAADKSRRKLSKQFVLALCGVLIGIVNGFFGSGGGMLAVPVLTFAAGLDERRAHATAIAVILPLCLISSIAYAATGSFDYSVFPSTILGVVAGGVIGALLLKKLSGDALTFIFYGLMLFAGIKML